MGITETLLNHAIILVTCRESFGLSILITEFVEKGRFFPAGIKVIPIQD